MDMRKIVEKGYDEGMYAEKYRPEDKLNALEKKFFSQLVKRLEKNAKILDLGCGTGIPYDSFLVKNDFEVHGIDISKNHIEQAIKNVPKAKFVQGDFSKIKFQESFDAIISCYAIFHIPRDEHKSLFTKMYKYLKPKGLILVTMGINEMKMEVSEFIGSKMAWSSYSASQNLRLIERAGFKILMSQEEHQDNEHHLWILAERQ